MVTPQSASNPRSIVKPRIVFFGTPAFAVPALTALIEINFKPVGVVTQPPEPVGRKQILTPSPISHVARIASIQLGEPKKLKDPDFLKWLTELKPDLAVLAAYGRILPSAVLAIPRLGFINIHPSLLPRHRGAAPIAGTILAGDQETGVTIIKLDEKVDHGPIIAQEKFAVPPNATTESLTPLLADLSAKLLLEIMPIFLAGKSTLLEQDHQQATFTKLLKRDDGAIDWNKSAAEIERQIRAYTSWPGSFTCWKTMRLKILAAELHPQTEAIAGAHKPGTVIVRDNKISVATGDGLLKILRLQLAGSKPQEVPEFLNGHKEFTTALLGPC